MRLTSFQVELYVSDLDVSIDFYRRVLGFSVGKQESNGYTPLRSGAVKIAISPITRLRTGHPIKFAPDGRPGQGVEFVFWVDDVSGLYTQIQAQDWPIFEELRRRPWGMEDFCVQDPDGYFLRFNSPVPVDPGAEK